MSPPQRTRLHSVVSPGLFFHCPCPQGSEPSGGDNGGGPKGPKSWRDRKNHFVPFLLPRGRLPTLQGTLRRQCVLVEELTPRAGGHGVTLGGSWLRPVAGEGCGGVDHGMGEPLTAGSGKQIVAAVTGSVSLQQS